MIGILGGMGTQAGLDFCNKLAVLNRGKIDQEYPLFLLYNKSNIPDRPENLHRYNKVLKSLLEGCNFLEKNQLHFGEALTIQGIKKEKLERGVQAAFNDCNMKMNQTGKKLQN